MQEVKEYIDNHGQHLRLICLRGIINTVYRAIDILLVSISGFAAISSWHLPPTDHPSP